MKIILIFILSLFLIFSHAYSQNLNIKEETYYVQAYYPKYLLKDKTASIFFYLPFEYGINEANISVVKDEIFSFESARFYALLDTGVVELSYRLKNARRNVSFIIRDFADTMFRKANFILCRLNFKAVFEGESNFRITTTLKDSSDKTIFFIAQDKNRNNSTSFRALKNDPFDQSIKIKSISNNKNDDKILEISNNSAIKFELKDLNNRQVLFLSFWIKGYNIKKIFSLNSFNKELVKFGIDKYNLADLKIYSSQLRIEDLNEAFYFEDIWNHLALAIDINQRKFSIYLNGILSYKFSLNIMDNLQIQIDNSESEDKKLIKIANIQEIEEDEIENILEERFFRKSKSSFNIPILEYAKNNEMLTIDTSADFVRVKIDNVKTTKDGMPLFIKDPELDAIITNDKVLLILRGDFLNEFDEAIFEISEEGINFIEFEKSILNSASSGNIEIKALIEKEKLKKATYFRAKLKKAKGETFYSNIVKVGAFSGFNFDLKQNFPNPFNSSSSFIVEIYEEDYFYINVYGATGKLIQKLYEGVLSKGSHKFEFSADNLTSGIYFYEVISSSGTKTKKMILTK